MNPAINKAGTSFAFQPPLEPADRARRSAHWYSHSTILIRFRRVSAVYVPCCLCGRRTGGTALPRVLECRRERCNRRCPTNDLSRRRGPVARRVAAPNPHAHAARRRDADGNTTIAADACRHRRNAGCGGHHGNAVCDSSAAATCHPGSERRQQRWRRRLFRDRPLRQRLATSPGAAASADAVANDEHLGARAARPLCAKAVPRIVCLLREAAVALAPRAVNEDVCCAGNRGTNPV